MIRPAEVSAASLTRRPFQPRTRPLLAGLSPHRENLFCGQRQRTPKEPVTTKNDARDRRWAESPAVTPGYVGDFHRRPEARQNEGVAGGAEEIRTDGHRGMSLTRRRFPRPARRQHVECLASLGERRSFTGGALVAAHDYIDIKRIEFDPAA